MTTEEDRAYRRALGGFATGVAIVTAGAAAAGYSAITINSFASVYLAPRLVVWSLGCESDRYDAFARAEGFGISVLSEAQVGLAQRFSQQNVSAIESGLLEHWDSAPVLRAAAARLACRLADSRIVGDHLMLFGEVTAFESEERAAPLIYFRGAYRALGGDAS